MLLRDIYPPRQTADTWIQFNLGAMPLRDNQKQHGRYEL